MLCTTDLDYESTVRAVRDPPAPEPKQVPTLPCPRHTLNNQLLWAGLVTGERTVTFEDTMGAVAYDGDLVAYADEVTKPSLALWATPGVLTAVHATSPASLAPASPSCSSPTL